MSTNPFRELKVDKWKVFALDMWYDNLFACLFCLSIYKHREVVVPLFAFTSKLASTIRKDLFPQHEVIQFMGRVIIGPFGSDRLLFFIVTQIGQSSQRGTVNTGVEKRALAYSS